MAKQMKRPTSITLSDLAVQELAALTATTKLNTSELIGLLIDREAQSYYRTWCKYQAITGQRTDQDQDMFQTWLNNQISRSAQS